MKREKQFHQENQIRFSYIQLDKMINNLLEVFKQQMQQRNGNSTQKANVQVKQDGRNVGEYPNESFQSSIANVVNELDCL